MILYKNNSQISFNTHTTILEKKLEGHFGLCRLENAERSWSWNAFHRMLAPFFFQRQSRKVNNSNKTYNGVEKGWGAKKNRPEDKSVDVSFSCIMMTAVNSEIRDKYIEHTTRKNFIEFSKTNLIYWNNIRFTTYVIV